MHTIKTREELRERLADWRRAGDHVALVPTMGNLHEGHLSLVKLARTHAERVVVSIFVNPSQFEPGSDYEQYPRTFDLDKRRLKRAGADLLFAPDVDTVYPFGIDTATRVTVPKLSDELCGAFRPGHFEGVTTVVARLFGLVMPDAAVFGEKDYQQQLLIRRMVDDLQWTVRVVTAPTIRGDDGLAYSSRNQYLTEDEQAIAPILYRELRRVALAIEGGNRDYAALESEAMTVLQKAGFKPDYVSVRRAENLDPPDRSSDELVVLAAARLGKARLIDNVKVAV